MLGTPPQTTQAKVRANLIANNTTLYGPDLEAVIANASQEYELHIKGV